MLKFVPQGWHQPGAGGPVHELRYPATRAQVREVQAVVYARHSQKAVEHALPNAFPAPAKHRHAIKTASAPAGLGEHI